MTTVTRMMPTTTKVDLTVEDVINSIGDKFFSLTFQKKDGTIRKMPKARFGVVKHTKGTGQKAKTANLLTVYDMDAKDYRSFYTDKVISIKSRGVVYDFTS